MGLGGGVDMGGVVGDQMISPETSTDSGPSFVTCLLGPMVLKLGTPGRTLRSSRVLQEPSEHLTESLNLTP